MKSAPDEQHRRQGITAWIGYGAGPVLAVLVWVIPGPADLSDSAQRVAGLAVWMASWWLSGALPLPATALLPLVLLPPMGVASMRDIAARYADPIIFLFMGGFFIAAATERWGLHRRFALAVVGVVGTEASRLVLAFMLATGFASMWLSNTATAVMMLPIAMAVIAFAKQESSVLVGPFSTALMLGVAYSASIGGVATLIGTPPNAIFAGSLETLTGRSIGFAEWMAVGVPIAVVMLLVTWLLLVRVLYPVRGRLPGVEERLRGERDRLGGWTTGERVTAAVFIAAAFSWIFRASKQMGGFTIPGLGDVIPGLSDAGIAIAAALILFATPVTVTERRFTLDWRTAEKVPWGVLLLFGGGLALASAFDQSGLAGWLGERLSVLAGVPGFVMVGAVALMFIFLTELTSNTATATMGMPIMASVAVAVGVEPIYLMATAAAAASLAFMLPVATPPNAIVFGSGEITAGQMARAGIWLNLIGVLVISVVMGVWMG